MLDELIARFGSAAVVRASPQMLDVPELAAYQRKLPGSTSGRVLVMRYGDDEIEIGRWSTKNDRYGGGHPGHAWRVQRRTQLN